MAGFYFTLCVNKIDKNKLLFLERKPYQLLLVFMQVPYPHRIGIWNGGPGEKPSEQGREPPVCLTNYHTYFIYKPNCK